MGDLARTIRGHAGLVALLACLGATLGGVYATAKPASIVATQAVLLSNPPPDLTTATAAPTIDTDAAFLTSDRVTSHVARALGTDAPFHGVESRLSVSAVTNTRVLLVSFRANSAAVASAGARAAAEALLRELHLREASQRAHLLSSLESRSSDLAHELSLAERHQTLDPATRSTDPLNRQIASLQGRLQNVTGQILAARYQATSPGVLVRDPVLHRSRDTLVICVTSGLMLGVLVALVAAWAVDRRLSRVRRPTVESIVECPLLAGVAIQPGGTPDLAPARKALNNYPQLVDVLAADSDRESRLVAKLLRDSIQPAEASRDERPLGAALVVSRRTRARHLLHREGRLSAAGVDVLGVIFVERDRRRVGSLRSES